LTPETANLSQDGAYALANNRWYLAARVATQITPSGLSARSRSFYLVSMRDKSETKRQANVYSLHESVGALLVTISTQSRDLWAELSFLGCFLL